MARHARSPSRTGPRVPRWLKVTVLSLLVVANLAVLGVWRLINDAEAAFRDNAVALDDVVAELEVRPVEATEPLYFLVIGSDSREGVDTAVFGDFAGARGDVVMVVRVDIDGGAAQILSIPRDTWVPIEGHGENRINSAYAFGGAPLMVKTARQLVDVPIHHYLEVDFAGFQALVDEIGGVEMDFEFAARDAKAKLDVPAGAVTLDGYQALAYARSRGYQELQDGTWRTVEADDIGRTGRQQELVLAILSRLKRPSTLTETGEIVAAVAQHMSVDAALAESSLTELAFSMRGIAGGDIETATLPTVGASRGGASVQLLEEGAAEAMIRAFGSGDPLDAEPVLGIVTVEVLNGNGIGGNAAVWAERLDAAGYQVDRIANADRRLERTAVVTVDDRAGAAEELVDELGFGSVEVGSVPTGVDAVVVLGNDAEIPDS